MFSTSPDRSAPTSDQVLGTAVVRAVRTGASAVDAGPATTALAAGAARTAVDSTYGVASALADVTSEATPDVGSRRVVVVLAVLTVGVLAWVWWRRDGRGRSGTDRVPDPTPVDRRV